MSNGGRRSKSQSDDSHTPNQQPPLSLRQSESASNSFSAPNLELSRSQQMLDEITQPPIPGSEIGLSAGTQPAQHSLHQALFYGLPPKSQPHSQASTPGRSRVEVVLNLPSPNKLSTNQYLKYDEDDDSEDQLVKSDITPIRRKRKAMIPPVIPSIEEDQVALAAPSSAVTSFDPESQPRKRGRPKGWRPGMPSTKTGLLTASSYKPRRPNGEKGAAQKSTGPPKKRGRPARPPTPSPREIWEKVQAKYIPFLCEWPECPAELHNVENLRRHILVVHGRADPLVCKWGKCTTREPLPTFEADYDFEAHVEENHIIPMQWHLGDGYQNESSDAKNDADPNALPDYLFDEDGKQVTPSVKDQKVEDFATWRANRKRLRKLLIQRDANAPSEDEDIVPKEAE